MQPIFGDFYCHGGDFCHLVAVRARVFPAQRFSTLLASRWLDIVFSFEFLDRNQLPLRSGVSRLPTLFSPTVLLLYLFFYLYPRPITRRRLR
jgi:hypothetical protein